MAEVTLKALTKSFKNITAVNSMDLAIRDGEFMVFVGPSGCGKTTALRMIAGLEEPTDGEILIGDRLVNDVSPKDRDIAMVFQNYALYPHMSVYDNMAFGLKLRKVPKAEIKSRVDEVAGMLGLQQLLDRKPKALSGGQRQRVALGRAIVRKPQVFLMDEPLSNLDAKLRVQTRNEIIKLHRRLGVTTIYVTHDQVEAMTMGDRITVMKDGLIQQVDTPLNLYNKPVNMFVAGFIGSPAMNFIQGKVEGDGKAPGVQRRFLPGEAAGRPGGTPEGAHRQGSRVGRSPERHLRQGHPPGHGERRRQRVQGNGRRARDHGRPRLRLPPRRLPPAGGRRGVRNAVEGADHHGLHRGYGTHPRLRQGNRADHLLEAARNPDVARGRRIRAGPLPFRRR